jgi:hypothetical protein
MSVFTPRTSLMLTVAIRVHLVPDQLESVYSTHTGVTVSPSVHALDRRSNIASAMKSSSTILDVLSSQPVLVPVGLPTTIVFAFLAKFCRRRRSPFHSVLLRCYLICLFASPTAPLLLLLFYKAASRHVDDRTVAAHQGQYGGESHR